jgi:hypothetical protein
MKRALAVIAIAASTGFAEQTLDVILVLDASAGTEHATDRIRARSFGKDMRVGIVNAQAPARVLLPLTEDRQKVDDALRKAGVRVGGSFGRVAVTQGWKLELARGLSEACRQFRDSASDASRAIIIVFAGEDPELPAALDRLERELQESRARLFAVAVARSTSSPSPGRPNKSEFPFPAGTARILADLAEASGGRVYRGAWDIGDILREAVRP